MHPLKSVLAGLCPGALDALSGAAEGYSPQAGLAAACAELERALSDRFTARTGLEMSLASAWAEEETLAELDIAAPSDEVHRARVAELLAERLLSQSPQGSLTPDRRDVHQLLDLAAVALDTSSEAQYAYAAIQSAELEVTEFGDIDISTPGRPAADIRAWQRAKLDEEAQTLASGRTRPPRLAEEKTTVPAIPAATRGKRKPSAALLENDACGEGFRALNAEGASSQIDDQLIEHCGYSLDSVTAVLGTARPAGMSQAGDPYPPIAHVSRAALVDAATASSGLPRDQVDAAARACTLSGEQSGRRNTGTGSSGNAAPGSPRAP